MLAISGPRRARGIVVAAVFVGSIQAVFAQDPSRPTVTDNSDILVAGPPSQTILLRSGMSRSITVTRAFKTVYITSPEIVDVIARTDHSAILVPKGVGATNIDIVDENSKLINTVNVIVDNFPGYGRVQVYNKDSPNSYTSFQCADTACQSVGVDVEEPAHAPATGAINKF